MSNSSSGPLRSFLIAVVSVPAKIVGWAWGVLTLPTRKLWGGVPWYARYLLFPIAGLVFAAQFIADLWDAMAG